MEFRCAIQYYYYHLNIKDGVDIEENYVPGKNRGQALTNEGPPEYCGDILDDPNLLWTEDFWTEERYNEVQKRLLQQGQNFVSPFWKSCYENRAYRYWHEFYKRNTDNFYKDRHYLHIVFPELAPEFNRHAQQTMKEIQNPSKELASCSIDDDIDKNQFNGQIDAPLRLLEVGCGVGNAILPLLDINQNLQIYAIDFAVSAIKILQQHPKVIETNRIFPSVCNVVNDILPVQDTSMDLILCMFVLSAISPDKLFDVLTKLSQALRPGGKLLIRDYGRYDEAQLRFGSHSKLADNFYVRQDGTCAYFFDIHELIQQCLAVGLVEEEAYYIKRQFANRQQKQARYRVWIHGKFIKKMK